MESNDLLGTYDALIVRRVIRGTQYPRINLFYNKSIFIYIDRVYRAYFVHIIPVQLNHSSNYGWTNPRLRYDIQEYGKILIP